MIFKRVSIMENRKRDGVDVRVDRFHLEEVPKKIENSSKEAIEILEYGEGKYRMEEYDWVFADSRLSPPEKFAIGLLRDMRLSSPYPTICLIDSLNTLPRLDLDIVEDLLIKEFLIEVLGERWVYPRMKCIGYTEQPVITIRTAPAWIGLDETFGFKRFMDTFAGLFTRPDDYEGDAE